jgi:hypothetical protein
VELAAALGAAQTGGLIMAAISSVFTISFVANLLGEDEEWLHDLSIGMEPGRRQPLGLWRWRGRDAAFTRDGIDNLREIIAEERAAGRRPQIRPPK